MTKLFIYSLISFSFCYNPICSLSEINFNRVQSISDSISKVEIILSPAFHSPSKLTFNKLNDSGYFIITPRSKSYTESADTFNFTIRQMESHTDIKKLWSPAFMYSIKPKEPEKWVLDGMGVKIYFSGSGINDSIDFGNMSPHSINSFLWGHLKYLRESTKDKRIKRYISNIKSYFY